MKRLNSQFTDSQYKLISSTQKKFRLYYAIMLKYYESHHKFLDGLPKISGSLLTNIAIKLDLETTSITIPSARAVRNYKIKILQHFNISPVKKTDKTDRIDLQLHLKNIISCEGIFEYEVLREYAQDFIVEHDISSIRGSSISRLVKSTIFQYEKDLFHNVVDGLDIETKAYLDELLIITDGMSKMNHLMRWVRGTTIESIKSETEKLRSLKLLKYPEVVTTLTAKHLKRYYRNIVNKYPSTIKEMPDASKYAQLIIFCFMRKTDINDSLVEILLDTTQKIFISGENKSRAKFSKLKEIRKNYDNRRVLKILVDTILDHEEDLINKAIYPKLPKKKLLDIQQKLSTKKLANKFSDLLYYSTRESFARYYRKIIVPIIEVLEFDSVSSNKMTNVINLIKDNINNNKRYYYSNQVLEIEQTIQKSHRDKIFDKNNRVKKIDLELCVLNKLRNKLRSKEVWVKGGYKYRNPEEDLPQDFDQNKEKYFNILKQPQDADTFINTLKAELKNSLFRLNNAIPQNKFVNILKKPKGLNHIDDILVRPIDWELIKRHYEYIIQHAISLKLGIADTEGLLRKFTKGNVQHEAYQAIRELGRAVKTIFLCNYFNSLELRQEIHSALNVVERWNGVNDIIFYGKTGVFRSNNPLELKLSTLCLHLLQLSMVYINTLMLQQILVESSWLERMSNEDKRAISPLISEHINPYGSFSLDLNKRLAINVDHTLFAREAA